ncbi:MAG: YdcF family protein [Pyrinomonadaceae bacterium]
MVTAAEQSPRLKSGAHQEGERATSRARRFAVAALVALAAWPFAAWVAARALVVDCELESADAVVVLAGSATYRERARHAAEIYARGRAPLVLLTDDGQRSGWSAERQTNPLFHERAAEELLKAGVPAERIRVLPGVVASTHDEALRVREFAESEGLRSLLVVTTAYQSRRARWTMERVLGASGVRVGVDAPPPGEESPPASVWWLRGLGWRLVPGEYLKLAYYALRY